MHVRRAIALAVGLVAAVAARRAHAWQEAHQIGGAATVVVDPSGVASVQDELRWRVARGQLGPIDLRNVDPSAVVEPEVAITADDGRKLGAHAVRRDDGTVRITLDDPRALMRGNFAVELRWRVDLIATRAISRDGATWRLAWSAPTAADGFDNARTTFDLPAAASEPRPIAADTGAVDDGAVATLRRGPERDILELVRPHVARGESATYTLRVDPRALLQAVDPRVRPPSNVSPAAEPDRVGEASLGIALAALAVAFALLVGHKGRAFAAACAARRGRARGLVPLPNGVRAALAGVALAAAVGLEVAGETTAAAACISLATLAAALRAPSTVPAARGPGRWLELRPEQAFAPDRGPGHWLDIGSAVGRVTAIVAGALVAAAAVIAQRFDAEGASFVVVDAAALVPLLVTGCASQLPPDGARSAAPWLAQAFRRMRAVPGLRVAPWARVAPDGIAADELRLLVVPKVAMPGVLGLEVGLAWSSTPVCPAATPEVLVRVIEGSPAAAKLAREVPRARTMPGRRPDERVVRLLPRAPTRSSTIALVRALGEALTDRRASEAPLAPSLRRRRSADAPVEALPE
jgi:hypothetical protein